MAPATHERSTTSQLTPRAVKWFETMGLERLLENSLSDPPVSDLVYAVVDGDEVRVLGERKQYLYNPEPGRLLTAMQGLVKDAGVVRTRVVDAAVDGDRLLLIDNTGNVISAERVIDASGPSRVVLRSLGLDKPSCLVLGLQLLVEPIERIGETFFYYDAQGVFDFVGWVVPKKKLLYVGAACVAGPGCGLTRDLVLDYVCRVLRSAGYRCPKRVRGFRYVYGRVPVGLGSFTIVEDVGSGLVYAVGEAGGYITARNGEGIPYALWTGTYAALYLDEHDKYREVVLRELVEAELLPKNKGGKGVL